MSVEQVENKVTAEDHLWNDALLLAEHELRTGGGPYRRLLQTAAWSVWSDTSARFRPNHMVWRQLVRDRTAHL